jgi:hypothetical protein
MTCEDMFNVILEYYQDLHSHTQKIYNRHIEQSEFEEARVDELTQQEIQRHIFLLEKNKPAFMILCLIRESMSNKIGK